MQVPVDERTGIRVNVIELGGFVFMGQVHVRPKGPAAGFIQDQTRGIEPARQHGHGTHQLFQDRAMQLIEQLPLHHTGPVPVTQDRLTDLILYP